jgi:hypothetical protein
LISDCPSGRRFYKGPRCGTKIISYLLSRSNR